MSGNKLFVDTNILIYLLRGDSEITKILEGKDILISFITEIELLSMPGITPMEQDVIAQLLRDCQIIDINHSIKKVSAEFRRTKKLKLPDSIISASAYCLKAPLLTADKAFEKLEELEVIIYSV